MPVPAENPVTEAKRVLGKILYCDEQLSSDDTVACGTCHGQGVVQMRQGFFDQGAFCLRHALIVSHTHVIT